MNKIIKKLEWVITQGGFLSGILLMVIVISIMREVIGRYLFNSQTPLALELSSYLLVAIVYIGAGWVALVDGHIRIDIIYERIKGTAKNVLDIIIYLIILFYCAILTWQSWELAYYSLARNIQSAQAMMWPLFPSQILVPIGALITILVFSIKLYRVFGSMRKKSPSAETVHTHIIEE